MRTVMFFLLLGAGHLTHAQGFDCSLEKPLHWPQGMPRELTAEKQEVEDLLVWQYVDLLSDAEWTRLDRKLTVFARETSNRIVVLVLDTLCGYPESDLAFEVGEKWGIGKAGWDNGIVVLVKPFGPPGQRAVFIATGYGLEGAIPDLTAKRVVDNEMIPRFREGRFFEGLDRGTDVLMALAKGEFNEQSHGHQRTPWGVLVFMLVIFIVMVFSWRSSVKRYARRNKVDFWTAMWLLSQMQQRHRRGGGSFGGGSFGGGGFGGFGGGSFGGGGAGGRW